jgi:ribonuclease HI
MHEAIASRNCNSSGLKDEPIHMINVTIQGDSDLVIQQLQGTWQCRSRRLEPLYVQAKRLLCDIQSHSNVTLTHVKRRFNKDADRK